MRPYIRLVRFECGDVYEIPSKVRNWTERGSDRRACGGTDAPESLVPVVIETHRVHPERLSDGGRAERDGGAERYRLEGTGDLTSADNTSFELLLTESGYVESYHIEVADDRFVTEYEGGFVPDDDLELAEPDWLEEAKRELESARS